MRRYTRIWWAIARSTTCVVSVVALAVGSAAFYTLLFAISMLAVVSTLALRTPPSPRRTAEFYGRARQHTARTAAEAGVLVVAVSALMTVTVWLLAVAVMLVLLTCPWSVRRIMRLRFRAQSPEPAIAPAQALEPLASHLHKEDQTDRGRVHREGDDGERLDAQVDAIYLECLSTAELCWAWRQSYVRLQQASPQWRLHVVASRERYLNELHRRDPRGISRWLDHGPRAASGPERFLGE